ncbi:hypothetical protein GDO78_014390 [Eleutherodactylus coqui]|uniref:Uncharacterized protein n=1 Tax=Eleutherodactylus coqui TaxID=57060 RepID=A0A8J6BLB4_ELECQ|nr:hypothetical protein GDO78_014390 [Eleutherodactylus coqui]
MCFSNKSYLKLKNGQKSHMYSKMAPLKTTACHTKNTHSQSCYGTMKAAMQKNICFTQKRAFYCAKVEKSNIYIYIHTILEVL